VRDLAAEFAEQHCKAIRCPLRMDRANGSSDLPAHLMVQVEAWAGRRAAPGS